MAVDWKRGIRLLRKQFRKLGLPDYWHKNSPHTYQVWQHGVMLVFLRRYALPYTEFVEWLPNTKLPEYMRLSAIPDEGTLCKEEKRLLPFLEAAAILLVLPLLPDAFVAGADMTGLQTKRASPYYIKRVMGSYSRRGFARLLFVVWKFYILVWELRLLPKDELKMLKSAWKKLKKKPSTLVYDKKGDSEPHHEWLEQQGIRSIAPVRKGARRGKRRRELMKSFPQKTYNKRNWNENTNYRFKNRYGDSLKAYTVKGRRAEVATKVLAQNLWTRLKAIITELFNMTQHSEYLNTALKNSFLFGCRSVLVACGTVARPFIRLRANKSSTKMQNSLGPGSIQPFFAMGKKALGEKATKVPAAAPHFLILAKSLNS